MGDNPPGGCEHKGGRTDPLITHPVIQYALLWEIIHQVDVSIKEGGPTPYKASSNTVRFTMWDNTPGGCEYKEDPPLRTTRPLINDPVPSTAPPGPFRM